MSEPRGPAAPDDGRAVTDGRTDGAAETDVSHVEWSALPDLGDEADHVEQVPDEDPPPDERQPPPETIWGAI